jgi:hypothetical protein
MVRWSRFAARIPRRFSPTFTAGLVEALLEYSGTMAETPNPGECRIPHGVTNLV